MRAARSTSRACCCPRTTAAAATRCRVDELAGEALDAQSFVGTVRTIGSALLDGKVLAFELASVLLLAALIGAIVVAQQTGSSALLVTAREAFTAGMDDALRFAAGVAVVALTARPHSAAAPESAPAVTAPPSSTGATPPELSTVRERILATDWSQNRRCSSLSPASRFAREERVNAPE